MRAFEDIAKWWIWQFGSDEWVACPPVKVGVLTAEGKYFATHAEALAFVVEAIENHTRHTGAAA